MIYFAHRGAPKYEAQNTIKSFQYARAAGRTYYETDVHKSADGQLVISHDPAVKGSRIVDTSNDILRLPLLKDFVDFIKPGETLNIELKTDDNPYLGIEEEVLSLIKGKESQIIISSFNYASLQKVRALNHDVKIAMLCYEFSLEKARALNAISININHNSLTKQMCAAAHSAGLKIFVFTVNTMQDLERAAALGADGVFTDDPYLKL